MKPELGFDGDGVWLAYPTDWTRCKMTQEEAIGLAFEILQHISEEGQLPGVTMLLSSPVLFHTHYTSTACMHELHDRCRRDCKFCKKLCLCDCHLGGEVDACAAGSVGAVPHLESCTD